MTDQLLNPQVTTVLICNRFSFCLAVSTAVPCRHRWVNADSGKWAEYRVDLQPQCLLGILLPLKIWQGAKDVSASQKKILLNLAVLAVEETPDFSPAFSFARDHHFCMYGNYHMWILIGHQWYVSVQSSDFSVRQRQFACCGDRNVVCWPMGSSNGSASRIC